MKIVEFSIKRPVTVTMLFVAIAVFGVVSYDQLALNLLPEISYPTLTVRTTYEAAAPAEVPNIMTPAQAAAYLLVAEADIMAMINDGSIKAKKLGSTYRISKAVIDEYMSS